MKKIICVAIIICICTLQGMAISNKNFNINSFEENIENHVEIVEKGIRLSYSIPSDLELEKERIIKSLEKINSKLNIDCKNGYIIAKDSETSITISLWNENNNVNVSMDYITSDQYINLKNLQERLGVLVNNKCSNTRYFLNLKGKIELADINNLKKELGKLLLESTFSTIKIDNGYVSEGKSKNGEDLKVAYMKYTSGDYIIIGVPRIFLTY